MNETESGPVDRAPADSCAAVPTPTPAPISGSRAERYQVVLHVDAQTLQPHGGTGRSTLDDGTRVSAETSRRLSCDAGLVTLRHDADGSILDVGRRTRTVPPAIRRALDARDRGCRFPGCGLRFTDAHHVTHWAQGGETRLDNLVLLCRHHHRLVHEGGWKVGWWGEGRPVFFDPRGGTHFDGRWRMPEVGDTPVEELMEQNRTRVVEEERERGRELDSGLALEATQEPESGLELDPGLGSEAMREPESGMGREPERGAGPESDRRGGGSSDGRTGCGDSGTSTRSAGSIRPSPTIWKREADIPDDVYFRALEAMGEAGL